MLACLALSAVGFTSTMTARPRALPTRVGIPRCDGIDQVRLFAVKRAGDRRSHSPCARERELSRRAASRLLTHAIHSSLAGS